MDEECENLSHRAEVFRSKLIEDFQIMECVTEKGRERAPVYNSSDVTTPHIMEELLYEAPQQMVNFKVYKRDQMEEVEEVDLRLRRIRNQTHLPLGVWAKWVGESDLFQRFLMALIIVNSISIGVQGELPISDHPGMVVLREFLNLIDSSTVVVFSVEILLKWMDNFRAFWKDYWNVFDFLVTVLSAIPLLLDPIIGGNSSGVSVVEQLAVFRILRALKMVARFGRLRIIVLTILKAIKSMVFITILLCAVAYIFAIVGVVFFESYTNSQRQDLAFQHSFSSLPNAMVTLFQLLTLDQWYRIYNDLVKVSGKAFTCIYILLWVWVGAFLFRNLFVGIMVNNFQSITADLVRRKEDRELSEEIARMKEELAEEITKHDTRMHKKSATFDPPSSDHQGASLLQEESSQAVMEEEEISEGWDQTVHSHLLALASSPVETLWPKDTLFRYLQMMEQLQDNMEEYDKIQNLITTCLVELMDSK